MWLRPIHLSPGYYKSNPKLTLIVTFFVHFVFVFILLYLFYRLSYFIRFISYLLFLPRFSGISLLLHYTGRTLGITPSSGRPLLDDDEEEEGHSNVLEIGHPHAIIMLITLMHAPS